MSNALPLPPHPSLEQYKKLARDLQHACKSPDPLAIRQWAVRWVEKLEQAYGPQKWAAVCGRENRPDDIERRWNELRETTPAMAKCALAGTQFFIAREHGFASWSKFALQVREMSRAGGRISEFEAAADAIIEGNAAALRKLLAGNPGLVRERSIREHHSTLLHYVSANGVEDFRQKTPQNIVEIANLLLDAGAEIDAESDAYGGGSTALGLAATSIHPERAGVQIALLQTLLDRGASLQLRSAGNNHSLVLGCLANGQPGAAKFLADRGAPLDMESAAALDRLDVLGTYFGRVGARLPQASPKQAESAFLYACGYGSLAAVRFLLERGVNPGARDEAGQTALHWASWAPEPEVIQLLIESGAPIDARDDRRTATPLDTVLWTWSNAPTDEVRRRCYQAVALLARAGAKLDRDWWRDRQKGSEILSRADSDLQMQAALEGQPDR